jgi:hypothetical protein
MSKRNKKPAEKPQAEKSRPAEVEKKPLPQKPTEWEPELDEIAERSR